MALAFSLSRSAGQRSRGPAMALCFGRFGVLWGAKLYVIIGDAAGRRLQLFRTLRSGVSARFRARRLVLKDGEVGQRHESNRVAGPPVPPCPRRNHFILTIGGWSQWCS